MAVITFNAPIELNPYSTGTFDPTPLFSDPSAYTVVTHTAADFKIQASADLGTGSPVTVRVDFTPAAGHSFAYTSGQPLPTGELGAITLSADPFGFGVFFTAASFTSLDDRHVNIADITSGGVLFTGNDTFNGVDISGDTDLFNAGPGHNVMNGAGANDILIAGDDGNQLTGGSGNDVLSTGVGHDTLDGNAGADSLYGGLGLDTFTVDSAADSPFGYTDNGNGTYRINGDVIYDFQPGVDTLDLSGTGFANIITAALGNSTLVYIDSNGNGVGESGEGMVTIYGASPHGTDLNIGTRGLTMYGSDQADSLVGSAQRDIVAGGAGNDTLDGGAGNDYVYGEVGGDRIHGGLGSDALIGGTSASPTDGSADTFVYTAAVESPYSGTDFDTIFGFESGIDKVDLSALTGVNASSIFISEFLGADFLYVNTAGTGYDMVMEFAGTTHLASSDIIFG